jgi:putative aldouronate transport system substrate-binding protein
MNIRKTAVLALSTILAATSLTGCGGKEKEAKADKNQTSAATVSTTKGGQEVQNVAYPIKTDKSLKVMMRMDPNLSTLGYKNYGETPFGKALEQQTGVKVEWTQPSDNNALLLALAAGTLPDIVIMNYDIYSGGISQMAQEGIAIPVTKYLEKNAPDYLKQLNSKSDYMKGVKGSDKEIYSFAFLRGDISTLSWRGVIARQDWLKKLNMKTPTTIDQFYNMLVAFRDQMGAKIPMSINSAWVPTLLTDGLITSAFGLPTAEEYQKDGKYHYGAYENEYKECLRFLNKLYKEGLLDVNWQTTDENTATSNLLTGVSGVQVTTSGRFESIMNNAKSNPEFDITAVPSLVAKEGEKPMYNLVSKWVDSDQNAFITSKCSNVELAVQFLNYAYSEKGNLLYNFGVEGESYTMKNGSPVFTETITKNPKGIPSTTIMAAYIMSYKSGPLVQDGRYYDQRMVLDQQKKSANIWGSTKVLDYKIQTINIPQKYADEYVSLWSDINTYISEMRAKFIYGEKSLDDFAKYQQELKKMGMDRVIELKQMALDEYNAK